MRAHYSYLKGDNVAVAQCPASCGELIQGWILGSEKLVSCPVDWYSTVAVTLRRRGKRASIVAGDGGARSGALAVSCALE